MGHISQKAQWSLTMQQGNGFIVIFPGKFSFSLTHTLRQSLNRSVIKEVVHTSWVQVWCYLAGYGAALWPHSALSTPQSQSWPNTAQCPGSTAHWTPADTMSDWTHSPAINSTYSLCFSFLKNMYALVIGLRMRQNAKGIWEWCRIVLLCDNGLNIKKQTPKTISANGSKVSYVEFYWKQINIDSIED